MGVKNSKVNDNFLQSGGTKEFFADFATNFMPHPATKQVTRRRDVDSVKQSLRNLLLTNKYERLRNPEYGGNIRRYLFENMNEMTDTEIRVDIEAMIKQFEPRVKTHEVIVQSNLETLEVNVTIKFGILNVSEDESLEINLYRAR